MVAINLVILNDSIELREFDYGRLGDNIIKTDIMYYVSAIIEKKIINKNQIIIYRLLLVQFGSNQQLA